MCDAIRKYKHSKLRRVGAQVENERTRARDAYRTDQRSSARQTSWKEQVALGKQAQEQLRNCKEASYRCALVPPHKIAALVKVRSGATAAAEM